MTEPENLWSTLDNDRDKELYMTAFWFGVNAGKDLENRIREMETGWIKERLEGVVNREG